MNRIIERAWLRREEKLGYSNRLGEIAGAAVALVGGRGRTEIPRFESFSLVEESWIRGDGYELAGFHLEHRKSRSDTDGGIACSDGEW
jgi:hypothetical protein